MKAITGSFSNKDNHYIEQTFKQTIQQYYQNKTQQNQTNIINLNNLIIQSISVPDEIKIQQIVAKLEVLKIKAKSSVQLKNSIERTVGHLKKPISMDVTESAIESCLRSEGNYGFCCFVVGRIWRNRVVRQIQEGKPFNIDHIIQLIWQKSKKNPSTAIQTIMQILISTPNLKPQPQPQFPTILSDIFTIHIQKYLKQKDKPTLSKCLKIISSIAKVNKTIIQNRQDKLALILYSQPGCTLQVQDILNICHQQEYSMKILQSELELEEKICGDNVDRIFVWSYYNMFCFLATQENIGKIYSFIRKHVKQGIQAELQFKLYQILNNFICVKGKQNIETLQFPININEKIVNSYLALHITILSHNGVVSSQFDMISFEKICKEKKLQSQATKKLFQSIKKMLSQNKNHNFNIQMSRFQSIKKQSSLSSLQQHHNYNMKKIPRSQQDIRQINKILSRQTNSADHLQNDNIKSLKNRAMDSLKISIMQNQYLNFQTILNCLDFQQYDADTIQKMLQIIDYQLKLNPGSINAINIPKLIQVIIDIDANANAGADDSNGNGGGVGVDGRNASVINFNNLGEILYLCLGNQEWRNKDNRSQRQWREYVIGLLKQISMLRLEKFNKISQISQAIKCIVQKNISQKQKQVKNIEQQVQIQSTIQKKQQKEKNKNQIVIPNKQIQPNHKQIQNQIKQIQKNQISQPKENQKSKKIKQAQNQLLHQHISQVKPKQVAQVSQNLANFGPLKISNIILKHKILRVLRSWRKKSKKSKQRFYKLRQWLQTQQAYTAKLLVMCKDIRDPLLHNKLINQMDSMIIFSNLDAMVTLSQLMVGKLREILATWHPLTTMLAPILGPISNCLKIYKQYSLNYNKAYEMMSKLAENPKYKEYVKVINLQNYLFSPVQRFQKYHLFVSDYRKSLPKDHKDYQTLQKALNQVLNVTNEINEFHQNQLKAKRMIELQKNFGNIVATARQYKSQFYTYCNDIKSKVYVFNDLLMIAKILTQQQTETQQLTHRIKLCSNSIVIRKADCTSCKNRLYVCGIDVSVHMSFKQKSLCEDAYNLIYGLIENMYLNQYKRLDLISQAKSRVKTSTASIRMSKQQAQQLINIKNVYHPLELSAQVICTEKTFIHQQLKIQYVIKLSTSKPYEICQYLFCDLAILEQLQKYLTLIYPNLKIPKFQIKSKDDDLTKIGEYLSMAVQKFLNFIIRNKHISKKPQLVLHRLGLHQSLWNYLNVNKLSLQCFCDACSHAQIFNGIDYYYKQKQMIKNSKFNFCILNSFLTQNTISSFVTKQMFKSLTLDEKLLWANSQQKRINYSLLEEKYFGKPLSLKVQVRMLSQFITIEVRKATIYSTVRQVIEEVCHIIGIQTTLDLALVFTHDKQIILDQDQYLQHIAKFIQEEEMEEGKKQAKNNENRYSIWQRFSFGSTDKNDKSKKTQLSLRKIFYFSRQLQQKACQNNPQRYQFLVGQMINKLHSECFILTRDELTLFCALVYCVENFSALVVQQKKQVSMQRLKIYLPESKWSQINPEFIQKVQHIISNQIQLNNKLIQIYQTILKNFTKNPTLNTQFFKLQNTEQSFLLGNLKHLYMGLSSKKVAISKSKSGGHLISYPISTFNYQIYSDSLYIETDEKIHRFTGNNLFMIHRIVQIYRVIFDFQH